MSQDVQKKPWEDELRSEMQRRIAAEAERDEFRRKMESYQSSLSRYKKKEGIDSVPKSTEESSNVQKLPEEARPPAQESKQPLHARSVTDAFCPECGDPNPDFKDETECKDCGHPLGAVATLGRIKNCPGCGATGKIAKRKKAEGGGNT